MNQFISFVLFLVIVTVSLDNSASKDIPSEGDGSVFSSFMGMFENVRKSIESNSGQAGKILNKLEESLQSEDPLHFRDLLKLLPVAEQEKVQRIAKFSADHPDIKKNVLKALSIAFPNLGELERLMEDPIFKKQVKNKAAMQEELLKSFKNKKTEL